MTRGARQIDDRGEFVGPPTRLEVERYGWSTLIAWIPRFIRWHLWARHGRDAA